MDIVQILIRQAKQFNFALRDMLARNGIKESDVQWARTGGTDRRFAALMEGQHAATMQQSANQSFSSYLYLASRASNNGF